MRGLEDYYEHLLAHLKEKVTAIKHIDLWNGQTQVEDKELPFNMPAVFIEFAEVNPTRLGKKLYTAIVDVRLHIVSEQLMDTDSNTSQSIRTEGLEHLRLMDDILYWLDGHSNVAVEFNSMSWTNTSFDENRSDIVEHVMGFETQIKIRSAQRTLQQIDPPSPALEIIPNVLPD